MAVLHEMLRHHHREDVHLFLEFDRVDVAGDDDRLGRAGRRHLGECHQQGGIQHIGVIDRNPVQMQDRRAVIIMVIAAGTRADAVAGKVFRLQVFPNRRGGRLAASDDGEIGKTLRFIVLHHVIRDPAAERSFLDLAVHGEGGQGLRWHSS